MSASSTVSLNWVDGWLLAALTDYRWRWSRPMKLWRLVDMTDVLFRGEASFDDVSFSLPRLIAAGLVTVDRDSSGELQIKATRAGFEMKARAKGPGHSIDRWATVLGAPSRSQAVTGDRSLGRYPDLTSRDWRRVRNRLDGVTFGDPD